MTNGQKNLYTFTHVKACFITWRESLLITPHSKRILALRPSFCVSHSHFPCPFPKCYNFLTKLENAVFILLFKSQLQFYITQDVVLSIKLTLKK